MIKPKDLRVGNFVYIFNQIEFVTGIVPMENGDWYVSHKGWNKDKNPIPEEILHTPDPIPLTDEWKKCLKIDKHKLPKWIEYVHEAQNYLRYFANVESLEIMDWDLFKYCK